MPDPVFFEHPNPITVGEVASETGAVLAAGAPDTEIVGIASLTGGGAGKLVFAEGRRNASALTCLRAAAVLTSEDLANNVPAGIAVLVTSAPQQAFLKIVNLLYPAAAGPNPWTAETGVSAQAVIDPSAHIEAGVIIEAGAVVGPNAAIGHGSVIAPHAVIGPSCQIGRGCHIGAHVSIRSALIGDNVIIHDGVRIGQDGFGFAPSATGLVKVPHIGRVIIQNQVEIGANSTIDRGAIDDTVIGEGTKIDNLVQIAHNVRIGRHCAIAAHCGISGSVTIGDGVMLGGRVGIADHITLGNRVQIAATSGVMNNVPDGEKWGGAPAKPIRAFFREMAALKALSSAKNKEE